LNVARAARALGVDVLATGLLAGAAGRYFAELATREPFPSEWIELGHGETRTATLIVHPPHDTTVINESGPAISESDWQSIGEHLLRLSAGRLVVFSGSLPGDAPDVRPFGHLLDGLLDAGRAVVVDSSGAALREALARRLWLL
jgi:tagatose 6-phosphate kinase